MTDMLHADHVALKCEPSRALDLRDSYPDIDAAWQMNKKHWNSVLLDGDLSSAFIRQLDRGSCPMAIGGMPRQPRERLTWQFTEAENFLSR